LSSFLKSLKNFQKIVSRSIKVLRISKFSFWKEKTLGGNRKFINEVHLAKWGAFSNMPPLEAVASYTHIFQPAPLLILKQSEKPQNTLTIDVN